MNVQGVSQEVVSLCRIATVCITSATCNNAITYRLNPIALLESSGAGCQLAIRGYLPVGTAEVSIKAGGQTIG